MQHCVKMAGIATLLAMIGAAQAQEPAAIDWSRAATLTVKLSSFDFTPSVLTLKAGQPVRLLLENDATAGHDFDAPDFFAHATYKAGTAAPPKGDVELDGGQKIEIDLIPETPGAYKLECSHFMHSMFGMTGKIQVTAAL